LRGEYAVTESRTVIARPSARAETDEINLSDLLDLLSSGRITIGLCLLGTVLATLLFVAASEPTYEARGSLQAEAPLSDAGAFSEAQATLGLSSAGKSTSAQMELLRSKRVLDPVIEEMSLDIRVTPKYFPFFGEYIARGFRPDSSGELADALPGFSRWAWGGELLEVGSMTVRPGAIGTAFTLVAGEGGSFEIVDFWGGTLASGRVGQDVQTAGATGLKLQVTSMRARPGTRFTLRKIARGDAIDDIRMRLNIDELGIKSGVIGVSFRSPDREEAETFVDRLMAAFIEDNRVRQVSVTNDIREYLQRQLPLLKERLGIATQKLAEYEARFGSPDMEKETVLLMQQSMKFRTKRLDVQLSLDKARARFGPESTRVKELLGALAAVDQEEQRLRERLDAFPTQNRDLQILKREARNLVQLNDVVQTTINSYLVAEAGSVANVRVVDRGNAKDVPVSPTPGILLVLACPLGLILGIIVVLLRRAMLRGVDNPSDVEFSTGLRTAMVPFEPSGRHETVPSIREGGRIPGALRVFAAEEPRSGVIMICGPAAEVGKTFVMANLGAVLARSGHRVVLVDADLRGGNVHRYFDDSLSPGISDFVTGSDAVEDVVRHTDIPGLDFVSSGEKQPGSVSVLRHPRFAELLAALRQDYETVLVSAPAVLARPDAIELGKHADQTILVMRAGRHTADEIVESLNRLEANGVKVGTGILNRVGESLGSYGYRGYGITRYA
jgi:tyrosine-protein kinase Etk/Wzc